MPFRLHSEDRVDIKKAADIVGISVNAFVLTIVMQSARSVIANSKVFDGKA